MKRQSIRASYWLRGGNWVQIRALRVENVTKNRLLSLIIRQSFRTMRRTKGGLNSDKDYQSRKVQRIVFFQSFRAMRRTVGLNSEKGYESRKRTTNRHSFKASAETPPPCTHPPRELALFKWFARFACSLPPPPKMESWLLDLIFGI